jgi:hypothetical protein
MSTPRHRLLYRVRSMQGLNRQPMLVYPNMGPYSVASCARKPSSIPEESSNESINSVMCKPNHR